MSEHGLLERARIARKLGQTFGTERDFEVSLGYRSAPRFLDYLSFYTRGDIAGRIVDLPASTCWRQNPVIEAENENFVPAVEELDERVRLFHNLTKVDKLSGIGRYGLLFLGTDGKVTDPPIESENVNPDRLEYLTVYHQGAAEIEKEEEDKTSPRFGLPTVYKIEFGSTATVRTTAQMDLQIPWERVIHVAENPITGRTLGTPRLEVVLNRLDDQNKVLGASAELFWQIVGGVLQMDLDPAVDATPEELEELEEKATEAIHGLRRTLTTRGLTLKRVAGQIPDPTGIYDALSQVIAAAAGIPQRILYGSERGELASSQDQREWNSRISGRQTDFCEPNILRATLDRLVQIGILPQPGSYDVFWPALDKPTNAERAEIAKNLSDAMTAVSPAGAVDVFFPPWEVRSLLFDLPAVPPDAPEGWAEFERANLGEDPDPPAMLERSSDGLAIREFREIDVPTFIRRIGSGTVPPQLQPGSEEG